MISKAQGKFIRLSPTKVRQVIDVVRGKAADDAKNLLFAMNKRPKEHLLKILNQAIANAKTKGFEARQLYISKITCDVGPVWKRFKAGGFGRATPILKRTAHIKIELDTKS
ncbi:MAG: 50S ribosomal protein L22 [Candidatus Omnitrophota bacterium]